MIEQFWRRGKKDMVRAGHLNLFKLPQLGITAVILLFITIMISASISDRDIRFSLSVKMPDGTTVDVKLVVGTSQIQLIKKSER
jgi:hypothetical protein